MELRIRELLKIRKESISSFANRVGITQANMSNIINGKSSPTLDTLYKIADAFNVPITELFENNNAGEINGFIKINGVLYEVNSFEDLKKLINMEQ